MGLANRLHQVWLEGLVNALKAILSTEGLAVSPAVYVYGYSKRPRPENRQIGISRPKKKGSVPVVSIHPSAWYSKGSVALCVLGAIDILAGREHGTSYQAITADLLHTLLVKMPEIPKNTDTLNPPAVGRMLLWTCPCTKIRSGRKDLKIKCLSCGEQLLLHEGVSK